MAEIELPDFARLTPELLARYDRPGPRYTSYPTAPHFHERFDEVAYREQLAIAAEGGSAPLSMYVHLPFCESRCTYCGCNVVISPNHGPEVGYLKSVAKELELVSAELGSRTSLNQVHWGGGTPTFLSPEQCEDLWQSITAHFEVADDAEVAIEVNPRVTSFEHLQTLRRLGFNRISMGLQDIHPKVQEAVARVQPLELTREHVVEARRLGFTSVNVDLIYGLPFQTEASFSTTVETVIEQLEPDRVACFSYAHVPWIKPHQRQLEESAMASGWDKFRIFTRAAAAFLEAGYRFVGFDHFARPDDELATALDDGTIHRNFMGYTVMPASDQIGIGVSAIGDVGGAYAANEKNLARYQRAVADGRLPIERGLMRTAEDELCGAVIRRIICSLELDFNWVGETLGIDPREHFADALVELETMVDDGLLVIDENGLRVTTNGRFFLRNICMPFDAYLNQASPGPVYSRTV